MALFGDSFEDKVKKALEKVRSQDLVETIEARIEGKVVTLVGTARSKQAKGEVMTLFNSLVETENTVNLLTIPAAPVSPAAAVQAEAALPPAPARRPELIHEVVKGDTLSALSRRYLGNSGRYMEIFNANKDKLSNPDLIQVGQKLRIPQ